MRPRFVAECSQPCGPGEVDELARGERGRQALARLVVDQLPARLGDRRVLAQQMAHARAPLRLPMPERRRCRRAARRAPPRPRRRLLLGLLAVLDDVAVLEQDALRRSRATAGVRRSRNSRSMQKCLNSSPCASRMIAARLAVGLDGEALLVPADRLGLLGQRRAQARERPRLGRQLVGRLVVLVGRHARHAIDRSRGVSRTGVRNRPARSASARASPRWSRRSGRSPRPIPAAPDSSHPSADRRYTPRPSRRHVSRGIAVRPATSAAGRSGGAGRRRARPCGAAGARPSSGRG